MTAGALVNVAGFLLGAALYGLLFAMAASSRATAAGVVALRPRWREWPNRPLVWAGALGLLWNVGAFLAGFPSVRTAPPMPLVVTLSFGALGFLPAVVVHVVTSRVATGPQPRERAAVVSAYIVSGTAAVLQLHALANGHDVPSRAALTLLTLGFLALLVALVALTRRARESRAVWIVALALFGVSALHLTQHTGRDAWWIEVLGHQGSLLLPVAILLRDYRFAFADLFLKRALCLSITVCVVLGLHVGLRRLEPDLGGTEVSLAAYLLAVTALVALVQGDVQRASSWLIDKIVLARADYADVLERLERDVAHVTDEDELVARAGERIARALGSQHIDTTTVALEAASPRPSVLVDAAARSAPAPHGEPFSGDQWDVTALVTIPTVDAPYPAWRLGRLGGERRLLSDDIRALEAAASLVGRRVDALRVVRERLVAAVREQQASRLATEAELRALRAQVNPHFLFNALTTIGYLIRTSPAAAETTLLRLTSLLRAVLRRTRFEFTTLHDELELVESYLDIERARFEERLRVTIDVPAALRGLRLPSLLLQPLVENAVKHGIAPLAAGGEVIVQARGISDAGRSSLRVTVHDTGPGATPAAWQRGRAAGVGLSTVEQRLACHFGPAGRLSIDSGSQGTTVAVELPIHAAAEAAAGWLEAVH
jgi:hypothetical protein